MLYCFLQAAAPRVTGFELRTDVVVSVAAVVLSVAALVYAIVQKKEMGRALRNLNRVAGELSNISTDLGATHTSLQAADDQLQNMLDRALKQTSTRYVGKFPENISDVIDLLAKAPGSVQIMVDFVGYCIYSNPTAFDTYVAHIKRLARQPGATVELVVYNEPGWHEQMDRQFGVADFQKEQASDRWRNYWSKRRFSVQHQQPQDRTAFFEYLRKKDVIAMEELRSEGIDVWESADCFAFFAWMTSKDEAVVSFPSARGPDDQVSFYTYDPHLIAVFRQMFAATRDASKPVANLASAASAQGTAAPAIPAASPDVVPKPTVQ